MVVILDKLFITTIKQLRLEIVFQNAEAKFLRIVDKTK